MGDWKDELRQAKNAHSFKELNSDWSAFGLKSEKNQPPKQKPFKCDDCTASFNLINNLQLHRRHQHKYVYEKVAPKPIKKRDPEEHKRQLKAASKKKRQRIPRSKWPSLIDSYDNAFDKLKWSEENNIKTKHPKRLISNWRKKLTEEEKNNEI